MISKPHGRGAGSSWQAYVSGELGLVGGILLMGGGGLGVGGLSRWEVRASLHDRPSYDGQKVTD